MPEPTVTIEVAWADGPLVAEPTWTDITYWVEAWRPLRGRNAEVGSVEAGTCSLLLNNSDGRFTPDRASSPYYPNVLPRRQLRVLAEYDGTTYEVFRGLIERWPVSIGAQGSSMVEITAVDVLKFFSKTPLLPPYEYFVLNQTDCVEFFKLDEGEGSQTFAGSVDLNRRAVIEANVNPYTSQATRDEATFTPGEGSIMPNGGGGSSLGFDGSQLNPEESSTIGEYGQTIGFGKFDLSTVDDTSHDGWTVSFVYQCDSPTLNQFTGEAQKNLIMTVVGPDGTRVLDVYYTPKTQASLSLKPGFSMDQITPVGGVYAAAVGPYSPEADEVAPEFAIGLGTTNHVAFGFLPSHNSPLGVPCCFLSVNGSVHYVAGVSALLGFPRSGPFEIRGNGLLYNNLATASPSGSGPLFLYHGNAHYQAVAVHNGIPDLEEMYQAALGYPGHTVEERIGYVLDQMGVPAALRDIEAAPLNTSEILHIGWEGEVNGVEELRAPALDTDGMVFVDRSGKVTYRSRFTRANPIATTLFDNAAGTGVEQPLSWEMSEDDVTNSVDLDNAFGVKVTVTNDASIATYGVSSESVSTRLASDNEAVQKAYWRVNRFGDPQLRIDQIELNPSAHATGDLWPLVLGLELNDIIGLRSLPDNAPATDLDYFVEQIAHDVIRDGDTLKWTTTLQVTTTKKREAWVLGDATYGVLGHTTTLHY